MNKFLVSTAIALSFLLAPFSTTFAAERSAFNAGDLIKSPSNPAVYYFAPNGKRYVFPNDKTYFTWYANFSTVKTIPAATLSTIPLGGNVTYRPGRKMVKITTNSHVYVVDQGGVLRHVATEQLAQSLYSISWKNQIDDVPDSYFTNYRLGTDIQTVSDYNPASVMTQTTTIAQDKQLSSEIATISIGTVDTSFVPSTITVKKGTSITWTNRDVVNHTVNGSGWQSGTIAPDQSYTRVFNTVGSFDYTCSIHPTMQGTVNVVN